MECPMCDKGILRRKKVSYSYKSFYIGEFDAIVCNKCGEAFFTEEAMNAIETKAKKIGIWGLERKTKISHSGHSLIIRIPKVIAKFIDLKDGQEVFIRPEGKDRIVVEVEGRTSA